MNQIQILFMSLWNSLACRLGFHSWVYDSLSSRQCSGCSVSQRYVDAGPCIYGGQETGYWNICRKEDA